MNENKNKDPFQESLDNYKEKLNEFLRMTGQTLEEYNKGKKG